MINQGRSAVGFSGGACLLLVSQVALAADPPGPGVPDDRGPALQAACTELVRDAELDPKPARLFSAGRCEEGTGRNASAWVHYRKAARRAEESGESGAEARAAAAKLEPTLSRIEIRVPAFDPRSIEVWLDGNLLRAEAVGFPIPVDPGSHEITVLASGRVPWSVKVSPPPASVTRIDVPVLVPSAQATPVVGQPDMPPSDRGPAAPLPTFTPQPTASTARDEDPGKSQRTVGWALGGAGVGGILIGTYFALKSSATRDDIPCKDNRCDGSQIDAVQRARNQNEIASWAFGLGGASLAAGVAVYVLAPTPLRTSAGFQVSPVFGANNAGLTATGRF
jgi:hypothetical protein